MLAWMTDLLALQTPRFIVRHAVTYYRSTRSNALGLETRQSVPG